MTAPIDLYDTHAHLDEVTEESLPSLLERAASLGVHRVNHVACHPGLILSELERFSPFSQISCTIGIHPLQTSTAPADDTELRKAYALHAHQIVALGEVGIDLHYSDSAPLSQQWALFDRMLALADEFVLPLVLHLRSLPDTDFSGVLSRVKGRPFIVHCYSEGWSRCRRILDHGGMVSFTGIVSFPGAHELHETVRQVPDESFCLETDSPFLAPVPHRGQTNEPGYTRYVAEAVAKLRGVGTKEIAQITTQNALRFYQPLAL